MEDSEDPKSSAAEHKAYDTLERDFQEVSEGLAGSTLSLEECVGCCIGRCPSPLSPLSPAAGAPRASYR